MHTEREALCAKEVPRAAHFHYLRGVVVRAIMKGCHERMRRRHYY